MPPKDSGMSTITLSVRLQRELRDGCAVICRSTMTFNEVVYWNPLKEYQRTWSHLVSVAKREYPGWQVDDWGILVGS